MRSGGEKPSCYISLCLSYYVVEFIEQVEYISRYICIYIYDIYTTLKRTRKKNRREEEEKNKHKNCTIREQTCTSPKMKLKIAKENPRFLFFYTFFSEGERKFRKLVHFVGNV